MYRTRGVCLLSFVRIFGQEPEPVCLFWLEALLQLCTTNLRSNIFSMWMNLWLFHCMGTISWAICTVTASVKTVHRDPFFSYGTQWLNDSANVGCIRAGICGLLRSSSSEQQVSHSDTCICLRCWNNCVCLLSSCNSLWTNFGADRGLFDVWRQNTKLLTRHCLLACCHVVVFVSLWKVNTGGRAEPTVNYGSSWGAAAEQIKENIFYKSS